MFTFAFALRFAMTLSFRVTFGNEASGIPRRSAQHKNQRNMFYAEDLAQELIVWHLAGTKVLQCLITEAFTMSFDRT